MSNPHIERAIEKIRDDLDEYKGYPDDIPWWERWKREREAMLEILLASGDRYSSFYQSARLLSNAILGEDL